MLQLNMEHWCLLVSKIAQLKSDHGQNILCCACVCICFYLNFYLITFNISLTKYVSFCTKIPLLPQPISPTLLSFLKLVAFSLYLCNSDINGMFVVVGFFSSDEAFAK